MTRTIQAILFDLGDTLLRFGRVDLERLFAEGARLARDYLLEQGCRVPSLRWYRFTHLMAIRWNVVKAVVHRREFNSFHVLSRQTAKLGVELSREQLLELCWRWYLPLRGCATVEEGLKEMLRDLAAADLKVAVVSNTFVPGETLDRHLAQEGLLELLPERVYSCDVGSRKPDGRIFQAALERLGTPAEEAIFVGDSPRADVWGAGRLGMVTVHLDPENRPVRRRRYRADHRIRSILELRTIVAQYRPSGGV